MKRMNLIERVTYIFVFATTLALTSCADDNIEEIIIEDAKQEEAMTKALVSCDFNLTNLVANATMTIDCAMDLDGQTIQLPSSTTLKYNGGTLTNGTIIFNGGYIDGRLLNNDLQLRGGVKLIDPVFVFEASKWPNIVQGSVDGATALKNTAEFESLIYRIKRMAATTFEMDEFDAYFETTKVTSTTTNQNFYASVEAINLPSGFHLKMSDNTHFRQYPAEEGIENGAIMAVRDVVNVKITGGNFHGDRNERGYSVNDVGLEGTHLFHVHSGRNITIDGVNFIEGSKGGIAIYSLGFSFNPDYKPTTGVQVRNCNFINIRRMGIALTDGRQIVIEGNTFTNTGQPMSGSDGGEVGYAINVEAFRTRNSSGTLMENEKAFDITIRNNTERNSRIGFAAATIGQDITVEDNDIETRVILSLTAGTTIRNNTFTADDTNPSAFAIFAAGSHSDTVFDNKIYGNVISGYPIGIALDTRDAEVYENSIANGEIGIQVRRTINTSVHHNNIGVNGTGINAANTYADNVSITDNTITSSKFHAYLNQLNSKAEYANYKFTLERNTFINEKKISIYNTKGVTVKSNTIEGGIEIGNAEKINILNNTKIAPVNCDGIRLYGTHTAVVISGNAIMEPTGASRFQCIKNTSTTPSGISITGNTCN